MADPQPTAPEFDFSNVDGTVVRIDPKCKYLVVLPADTELELVERIAGHFADWWASENSPVGFMLGPAKIVKVSDGEEA